MNGKPLSGPAQDLYTKFMEGFREAMGHSIEEPWELSYTFINAIRRREMGPEDLRGDEVLNVLVMTADVNYIELKDDWDKLSIEERKAVIERIIVAAASLGLMSLLGSIANYPRPNEKEEILHVAANYYEGKISYNEMASEIENIIWPTQLIKTLYWKYIESYRKGMSLARYLPERAVKAIVDVYLVNLIRLQMLDNIYYLPSVYPRFLE